MSFDLGHRTSRRWGERLIALLLFGCGLISVLTTIGIVVVLVTESAGFFREVPIAEFLTGTRWSPMYSEQHFGILPGMTGHVADALDGGLPHPVRLVIRQFHEQRVCRSIRWPPPSAGGMVSSL